MHHHPGGEPRHIMQGARSALVREDVRAQPPEVARTSIEGLFDAVQFMVASLTPEMRQLVTTNEAPIDGAGAGTPAPAVGAAPPAHSGTVAAAVQGGAALETAADVDNSLG